MSQKNPERRNDDEEEREFVGITAAPSLVQANPVVVARCFKCRSQREMKHPTEVTMKNGKKAISGNCPVCGTKMFRIGSIPFA